MSMFGGNGKVEAKKEQPAVGFASNNIIGTGTVITGDIETVGSIRIDGKLIGNLTCKAKLALGKGAYIDGNINAQNAEIEGEVTGILRIEDTLILKATAVILGDIYTARLVVENGAKFNGNCKMGEQINVKEIKLPAEELGKDVKKAKAS